MLIDTHCHMNIMVKKAFDTPLTQQECDAAKLIMQRAKNAQVTKIINVGTSVIESKNCVTLAQHYESAYATIGIHPTDATDAWRADIHALTLLLHHKEKNKIVGIGECGIDKYHKNYDAQRQRDCFKAQIELALTYDCAVVVHSREAADETLTVLSEYVKNGLRAVMHCFSYDQSIATDVINMNFLLGIGGTVTYPKNNELRSIVANTPLKHLVLETDAPYLPPQSLRGTQNSPEHIRTIAEFIAQLRGQNFDLISHETTVQAEALFLL
jgi:TatD DNase family protein